MDLKVQRAAAGALRTLAFKNDENKNQVSALFDIVLIPSICISVWLVFVLQIVECNALPTLILMLRSEDAAIHYEAVRFYYLAKNHYMIGCNNTMKLIAQNQALNSPCKSYRLVLKGKSYDLEASRELL